MGCCSKKKETEINVDLLDVISDDQNNIKKVNEDYNLSEKMTKEDFSTIKVLGQGSFGKVLLVRMRSNNKLYAMKMLDKSFLKAKKQEEHTKTERDLMVKLNSPFILNIKFAFQDSTNVYIITEFMQGGDLFFHLHSNRKFKEEQAKFYMIEIILAIEELHKNNMVYRDLKPENILMDQFGHLKISDFGLSKIIHKMTDKAYTLCGTPQYVAPEILYKKGYEKGIDWWSFGCVAYEMLTGKLPYEIPVGPKLSLEMFKPKVEFPEGINKDLKDLIEKLLTKEPKKRLGYGTDDAKAVKNHPYFKDVDWDLYLNKKVDPPFVPDLEDDEDLKYFDKYFTNESVSNINKPEAESNKDSKTPMNIKGFTYISDSMRNNDTKQPNDNYITNTNYL